MKNQMKSVFSTQVHASNEILKLLSGNNDLCRFVGSVQEQARKQAFEEAAQFAYKPIMDAIGMTHGIRHNEVATNACNKIRALADNKK